MEYPPAKRQRSTKFDTRHRHRHHAKDSEDSNGEVEPQDGPYAQFEATSPPFIADNLLRAQDTVVSEVRQGRVQGHLQRRQGVTVDVAVTLDSTAVVSIGVDSDGTPTTTGTTTLAADTSSTSADSTNSSSSPASTPETYASPEASLSISGVASSTSSASTVSTAISGGVTSSSPNAQPATSPSTTLPASTASLSSSITDSSATSLTTSSSGISGYGFITTSTLEATSSSVGSDDTSSLFPSLTATNGTTTSGVSYSSSGSDTVTAAGVTSSAASFSGIESTGANVTIAGVHTTHHSSFSTKPHYSSSSHSTSSGFRSSTSTSRFPSSSRSSTASSSTETYTGFAGASGTGDGAPGATSSSSANATVDTHNDDTTVAPPATIAGSVVGSVAGVALLGVIIFYLLRMYHKKRSLGTGTSNSARQLGVEDPFGDPAPGDAGAMTQHSGTAFFSAAAAGLFGRMSKHSEPEVPAEERGFRKVSGRKLPSAFSPGMEALPAGAAAVSRSGPTDKEMGMYKESGSSPINSENPFESPTGSDRSAGDTSDWYPRGNDSFATTAVPPGTASTGLTHFVPGVAGADFGRERYPSSTYSVDTSGVPRPYSPPQNTRLTETLLPSPARTPVIQQPSPFGRVSHVPGIGHGDGPALDSRVSSPTRQPSGRGLSIDGTRGSRFAENIP